MWVTSVSPPNLRSIIGQESIETYTDIHTQAESDTLPIYDIGSSKNFIGFL